MPPRTLWNPVVVRLSTAPRRLAPPHPENGRLIPFTSPLVGSLHYLSPSSPHATHHLPFRSPALARIRRRTLVAASSYHLSHIEHEFLAIAHCLTSPPHCSRTPITPYPPSVHPVRFVCFHLILLVSCRSSHSANCTIPAAAVRPISAAAPPLL